MPPNPNPSSLSSLALSERNQLILGGANLASNTLNNVLSTISSERKHKIEHPDGSKTTANNTGARAPISIGLFNVVGSTNDNRIVIEQEDNRKGGIGIGHGVAFVGGAAIGVAAGIVAYKYLKNQEKKTRTVRDLFGSKC
jgi:hypothetical protein